jgi:hypothetical protein
MFEKALSFNQNLGAWDMTNLIGVNNMLSGSGMQWIQYDATLKGWAAQSLKQDRVFTATGLEYCGATAERESLVNAYNWTISGDVENLQYCTPTEIRFLSSGSGNLSIEENFTEGSVLGQLEVVDGDAFQDNYIFDFLCQSPTADTQFFGILNDTLIAESLFDYELPADDNLDNIYQLCIRVTDQSNNAYEQYMTISVNNIDDDTDQGGRVLGVAVDNEGSVTDENSGQVLAESDGGAVLADTGFSVITVVAVGGLIVLLVIIIGIFRNSTYYYLWN